jgi:hypothetical protein
MRFTYRFLKPSGRGYGFLSGFLPFSFAKTGRSCVSLKKEKSQGKAVEVTVNSKEENTFIWILVKNSASFTTAETHFDPSCTQLKKRVLKIA